MIARRLITIAAAGALGSLTMPTTAGAAPADSYHGTFSQVVYTPEVGPQTSLDASGTWNVTIRADDIATATFNIFVAGRHHLAYGMPSQAVTRTTTGWTFSFPTLAGQLTVTLSGSTLTYDIPNYSLDETSYADVTYLGELR